MFKRILLAMLLAVPGLAAAVTCQTFAAGDTGYITKLNLLVAGCTPTGGSAAISPLTTKGDVWGYSSLNARIPVGTNGQVLTADSAQTLGLKWATPSAGSSLTATYIGYGDGSNALTGTSDLAYSTAGGILGVSKTLDGFTYVTVTNPSTGTAAGATLSAGDSASAYVRLTKYGTAFTTNGLLVAGLGALFNDSGASLFANAAAADFIWSRGGFAATNEVARLGAGTLSLGVAGTTSGSLALKGSTSGTATITVDAAVGTPTLTFGSATATFSGTVTDSKGDVRNLPQNSQSAAYTTVLADCGKHILHPSADTTARVFTIDSNANVAAPIGCMITFVNQNAGGVVTVAITSDTMRLAGAGTTGSRTMAANCVATALKIVSTEWIISGGSCLT